MLAAYRHHRRSHLPGTLRNATESLRLARLDGKAGKARYPKTYLSKISQAVTDATPYRAGERIVHVDNPDLFGLRLVGKVEAESYGCSGWRTRRDTCGWYTDPYGDVFRDGSGLCWGVVYQLPARDGAARFVAGYQFGGMDDGPTLNLSEIFEAPRGAGGYYDQDPADLRAAKEAARRADDMARTAAEAEREYQTAWRLGSLYAEAGEEIVEARRQALAILAERRKLPSIEAPALCKALRDKVSDLLDTIREARAKRARYLDGEDDTLCVFMDARTKGAFCEGAGLSTFPA